MCPPFALGGYTVRYFAGVVLTVGATPDGSLVVRQPGEEVPEAANWPNLRAYINTGHIRVDFSDAQKALTPKPPMPTEPAPEAVQASPGSAPEAPKPRRGRPPKMPKQ